MKKIKIDSITENGETKEVSVAQFSTEEINILKQYMECVKELEEINLVKNGLPALKKMTWDEGRGSKFKFSDFSMQELRELLHVARPLILSEEPASFEKVVGLLGRKFDGADFRKRLKEIQKLYKNGEYNRLFQYSIGDIPIFDNKTLYLWLNAEQYHHDPAKREKIKILNENLRKDDLRGLMASQFSGKIKAVFYIAHFVYQILKQSDI